MKKIISASFVLAVSLFICLPAMAAESPVVAVWSIRAGTGVDQDEIARMEFEITRVLKAKSAFRVLDLNERDALLTEPGAPSRDCVTGECLSLAGRILKAEWLVTGDVGKTGSSYQLNLLLLRASTGKVVGAVTRETTSGGLIRATRDAALVFAAQSPDLAASSGQGSAATDHRIESEGPSGTIVIKTKPQGAQAYIDAYLIGRTPTVAYRVPVGTHSVTLVLEGHDTVQSTITVKEGETAVVSQILLMHTGSIEIESLPTGATLYMDGHALGKTPQKLDGLLVGSHRVRIIQEGYQPLETTVTIDENQTQKRTFTLRQKGPLLLVTSQPDGAKVFIDGKSVGQTLYRGMIEPGKHVITVQLSGYKGETRTVEIDNNQGSYAFHFKLVRGSSPIMSPPSGTESAENAPRSSHSSRNPDAQKLYEQATNSNDIEERIRLYQEAIALDQEFAAAHNDLGVDYAEQGRWDEAISEYRKALSIDPNYTFPHNNLGQAYINTGRLDEAISELKIALSIDPKYATAHYNLGKAYFSQDRLDEALKEFEETVSLSPRNVNGYFNMGRTLKRLKQYDRAIQAYLKCLELEPDYVDVYFNLADIYDSMGDRKSAIYYYEKYISLENRAGEAQWVEKARERIRALSGSE